jgi:hypothetical protein
MFKVKAEVVLLTGDLSIAWFLSPLAKRGASSISFWISDR